MDPITLLLLILGGGAVAYALFNWDELRNRVWAWAERNGHRRLQRVVLRLDTLVGQARKRLRVLVKTSAWRAEQISEERELEESEIPPEVREELRRRDSVRLDVTKQVLTT